MPSCVFFSVGEWLVEYMDAKGTTYGQWSLTILSGTSNIQRLTSVDFTLCSLNVLASGSEELPVSCPSWLALISE